METFERKETKYLLTPMQYIQFRALAEGHLAPAEYPEGDVCSIYYDTPDDTLVNRSIAGGKYKEKLRVRMYGNAEPDSPVFVEVKKKFKGVTYKRRVNCTLAAAKAFLEGMDYELAVNAWPLASEQEHAASLSTQSRQIAAEIAWMRDHYAGIAPKMEIRTHRLSFVDAHNPEVRITSDADVRWQQAGDVRSRAMFPNGERILEVKCADAFPMWLVAVLNECGARPQSVSKYGRAYQAAMAGTLLQVQAAVDKRVAAAALRQPVAATAAPAAPALPTRKAAAVSPARSFASRMKDGFAAATQAFVRKPAHAAHR